jgi:hypothetical protein
MSTVFRNSRLNRSYLARLMDPARQEGVLAPDITTARVRETPVRETLFDPPAAPAARPAPASTASVLEERHPEIAKAVSLLWGYPEMNEYFDRLWLAEGNQGPIDPDAMSELMVLARVHQAVVPQRPARTLAQIYGSSRLHDAKPAEQDPWSQVPHRR